MIGKTKTASLLKHSVNAVEAELLHTYTWVSHTFLCKSVTSGLWCVLSEHWRAQAWWPPLQNGPAGFGGSRGALHTLENHGHRAAGIHRGGQPRLLCRQHVGQGEFCPSLSTTFLGPSSLLISLPRTPTKSLTNGTPLCVFAVMKDNVGWNQLFTR